MRHLLSLYKHYATEGSERSSREDEIGDMRHTLWVLIWSPACSQLTMKERIVVLGRYSLMDWIIDVVKEPNFDRSKVVCIPYTIGDER